MLSDLDLVEPRPGAARLVLQHHASWGDMKRKKCPPPPPLRIRTPIATRQNGLTRARSASIGNGGVCWVMAMGICGPSRLGYDRRALNLEAAEGLKEIGKY